MKWKRAPLKPSQFPIDSRVDALLSNAVTISETQTDPLNTSHRDDKESKDQAGDGERSGFNPNTPDGDLEQLGAELEQAGMLAMVSERACA